jgi:hypothetical protein
MIPLIPSQREALFRAVLEITALCASRWLDFCRGASPNTASHPANAGWLAVGWNALYR